MERHKKTLVNIAKKINTYICYIETSGYWDRYPAPEFNFDIFIITIVFSYVPTEEYVNFLTHVGKNIRIRNKSDKSKTIMFLADLQEVY